MPIGEVVVYNRTDCCSERLADLDSVVTGDGIEWTSLTGPALARTSVVMFGH